MNVHEIELFFIHSGPVLQAALVPLGYPGSVNFSYFHLNMYTSPALLSIIIYAAIIVIIFYKFNEYVVLEQDSQNINKVYGDDSVNVNNADYGKIELIPFRY